MEITTIQTGEQMSGLAFVEAKMEPVVDKAKALAVAQDALDRLSFRASVQRQTYGQGSVALSLDECREDVEVQQVIEKVEKACSTCLLGACLLSKVRLYDELTFGELGMPFAPVQLSRVPVGDVFLNFRREAVDKSLLPIFGQFEMDKLESFFEGKVMGNGDGDWDEEGEYADFLRGCAEQGQAFDDPEDALVAALKNFIANDGCLTVLPVLAENYEECDWDDEDDWDDDDDDDHHSCDSRNASTCAGVGVQSSTRALSLRSWRLSAVFSRASYAAASLSWWLAA